MGSRGFDPGPDNWQVSADELDSGQFDEPDEWQDYSDE
jgi:hypothetical protein